MARALFTFFISVIVVAQTGSSWAAPAKWTMRTSHRGMARSIADSVQFSQLRASDAAPVPTETEYAYLAHLLARLRLRPTETLGLRFGLDTGLFAFSNADATLDGRDLAERIKETFLLGEVDAALQFGANGEVELRVGRFRPRIGNGAVFDSYALGIEVDVDMTLSESALPIVGRLDVLLPDATFTDRLKTSPLINVEIGAEPHRNHRISIIGAFLLNEQDTFAPVLEDAVARGHQLEIRDRFDEIASLAPMPALARARLDVFADNLAAAYNDGLIGYDVTTRGYAGWAGLNERSRFGDLTLSATALFGFGELDANIAPGGSFANALALTEVPERLKTELVGGITGDHQIGLRSFFGQLEARWQLDVVDLEGYGLFLTGDAGLSPSAARIDQTFSSFVALAPLLPKSSIFFGGPVASAYATPQIVSVAPDGAGLFAIGASALLPLGERVTVEGRGGTFWSVVDGARGESRHLGEEVDLIAEVSLGEGLYVTVDLGLFAPGAYYGDSPLAFQAIAGLSFDRNF